jgi:succinylglutamate desuccinylase
MVRCPFSAGIHGDEINGVEIVRQLITKKINKPKRDHLYSRNYVWFP